MSEKRSIELKQEFQDALRRLASARASYEDEPRDPKRIAALGAARILLEDARSAMADERRRLGLDSPWRPQPSATDRVQPPPLWSIDGSSS